MTDEYEVAVIWTQTFGTSTLGDYGDVITVTVYQLPIFFRISREPCAQASNFAIDILSP